MKAAPAATKLALSVVAITLAVMYGYPNFRQFLKADDVIDQGQRGLIVIGSHGGHRNYSLQVRNSIDRAGALTMTFYFVAKNVKYGDGYNGFDVHTAIAFVGEGMQAVRCGDSTAPLTSKKVSKLPPGLRRAVKADASGGVASATNFNNIAGSKFYQGVDSTPARVYSMQLRLMKDQEVRYGRVVDGDVIWAETCHLPPSSIWRASEKGNPAKASRRSLLLPQVNWTSYGNRTDHQQNLNVTSSIERTSGTKLAEAYPPLNTQGDYWWADSKVSWIGRPREIGNIGYNEQSTYIFDDRGGEDDRALYLTLAGSALGILGTLLVFVASRLVDLAFWTAKRRAIGRTTQT
ncbi:hypothetical protein ASE12_19595 [Aeromicrobium sp. Root236]|uniref:hypothetical protein n=1 Tax=Aeromicrobium sp. Root236 TaxID=1736498 RepID=UPI0006F3E5D8|nr:hypothetical protein [Aeromicrobium sp. Root236]KRC66779.1 hypothetical protein ASE12_19595 [Aeromicrobium sp. Root236]